MQQLVIDILTPVLATLVVSLVALLLRSLDKWVRSNVSTREYAMLSAFATVAVQAAEKQFAGKDGNLKKAFAHEVVGPLLADYKIKVDLKTVDAAIEAAVQREFSK